MPAEPVTASLPAVFTALPLFAVGCVAAGLLAHTLRKVRSNDWVVALGWGLGGSLAVGTGLWLGQMLAWGDAAPTDGLWFAPLPLAGAWLTAVLGVAGAVAIARRPPSHRVANAFLALVLLPTLVLLFVLAGASLARAPHWAQVEWPGLALALLILAAGLVGAIHLLNGPRRRWVRGASTQRVLGMAVFGLALLLAQPLALQAVPLALAPTGALALPAGAIDPRLASALFTFAAVLLALAVVCAFVDARSGRRAHVLAGSLQSANRRLRELAYRDALTGLPNRLHFEDRLGETLSQVGRAPSAMAVLFIDLDGFKAVNESFGHAAGDEVLREVGKRLQTLARRHDTLARAGGDEFLLLLADPGAPEAAAAAAQQTLHALMAPYHLPGGTPVRLSCSIGIALYPEHGPTSKLIGNADAAMFAVKRTGGSTYAFYEPRMEQDASDQLALQSDLRQAIERNELALHYQPKVDARTRELTGVEALVRWMHPVRGAVGPSELIAVAERFGQIGVIGQWVLGEACRQIAAWDAQGLRMRVAVNLSAHQLRQDDLVQRVRQTFEAHGTDPSLVTFEITESVAMEDTQATVRSFAQLARAGVSLAIDDFGTGHSSLAYLRTLPARQLKIDRSFVHDLGLSGDAMAVVDAVIRLAHALGLRVVAEGVETERQCEILVTLGCDEFQGYLFARPMDAQRVALWAAGERGLRPSLDVPSENRPPPTLQ